MNPLAISIPEEGTEAWLAATANLRFIRDVEAPAALVLDDGGHAAIVAARRQGLVIVSVRDLIPEEVGRYLETLSPSAFEATLQLVLRRLKACRNLGLRAATLGLGLDRLDTAPDAAIGTRVDLLRRLIPAAGERNVDLAVPIRCPPPFPASRQWVIAANLLHDIMHPALRLALDVFPFELPEGFDVAAFVRKFCFQTSALRLHCDAEQGEQLTLEMVGPWWQALRRHNYRGVMAIRPRVTSPERIEGVCRRLDRLAGDLSPSSLPAED